MIIKVNSSLLCRLDRYLKRLYPALTQGLLEKALRRGNIKVNQAKALASLRIKQDDEIFIEDSLNFIPSENLETSFSESAIKLAQKILNQYLIYENEHLIAINKPAGLPAQGGSKINLSINDALNYLNSQGNDYKLVHRLDKDTSGVFLIAKNYEASVKLAQAFQDKSIKKTYLAGVIGKPPQNSGEISAFIGKKRGVAYEIVDIDEKNGKLATTHYKILRSLGNNRFLVEFNPITGRMHQLRFHAKMLGCPIIGDTKYGAHEATFSKHMLLHAKSIIIPSIIFGEEIIIEMELPKYFLGIAS